MLLGMVGVARRRFMLGGMAASVLMLLVFRGMRWVLTMMLAMRCMMFRGMRVTMRRMVRLRFMFGAMGGFFNQRRGGLGLFFHQ